MPIPLSPLHPSPPVTYTEPAGGRCTCPPRRPGDTVLTLRNHEGDRAEQAEESRARPCRKEQAGGPSPGSCPVSAAEPRAGEVTVGLMSRVGPSTNAAGQEMSGSQITARSGKDGIRTEGRQVLTCAIV